MPVVTNGKLIYTAHPEREYEHGVHSKYVEEELNTDTIELNGGILVRLIAISSDPYMRYRMRDKSIPMFAPALTIGEPMDNFAVGQVVRSEDPNFTVGDYAAGFFEFANYSVYPGKSSHAFKFCFKVPKVPGLPLSSYTGTFGLAGKTAYTGWHLWGKEKAKTSKTLFVSGAGGALGLFLLEYVRIVSPHLKIIATAGTAEKLELCKKAGADVVFNYKEVDLEKALAEHGPIDIYWDNTAGPILDAALANINFFGLIIACGAVSEINHDPSAYVKYFGKIFQHCVTVHGFIFRFGPDAVRASEEFNKEVPPLVAAGKITILEDRFQGLKEAGRALESVHSGKNLGKAVVIVGEEEV
ncbi:alcohol dehydrogenase [Cristinia sonorae]|uniref:Alcohol dehydrogenase n=1 Tax=Cristinia sonorae TaxID=1940300 RepID=A0A8K0UQB8_9AGAR|nr:alcohol dehydrogenase [Cristinia sonorae]